MFYIKVFEEDYIEFILCEDYKLNMDVLIDDYICFNLIWNCVFDMLFMFLYIDEVWVWEKI